MKPQKRSPIVNIAISAVLLASIVVGYRVVNGLMATPFSMRSTLPQRFGGMNPIDVPEPIVDSGKPTQNAITLVQVGTGGLSMHAFGTFNPPVTYDSGSEPGMISFVFKTTGDLGCKQISVPRAKGVYKFPVGADTLVVEQRPMDLLAGSTKDTVSYSGTRNLGRPGEEHSSDGKFVETIRYWLPAHPAPDYEPKFRVADAEVTAAGNQGDVKNFTLDLMPVSLADRLLVQVTPLTEAGTPTGATVNLATRIFGASYPVASLRCFYSVDTTKLRLSAHLLGRGDSGATWILRNIPRTQHSSAATMASIKSATVGSIEITACSAIDPDDLSGRPEFFEEWHIQKPGVWQVDPPRNLDDHYRIGMPAIRTIIRARNANNIPGEASVTVQSIKSTLGLAPTQDRSPEPIGADLSICGPYTGNPTNWSGADVEIGGGYPGQQVPAVQVDGEVETNEAVNETLKVGGYTLANDPRIGLCVVWNKADAFRTTSGVSVIPLNPADIVDVHGALTASSQPLSSIASSQASATVYFAIKIPPGSSVPAMAMRYGYPNGQETPAPNIDLPRPFDDSAFTVTAGWKDVWLPGAPHAPTDPMNPVQTPMQTLERDQYKVVAKCFVFTGVASAIPGSLPLEIKTIRVIKKPFTLVVPIFDKFPTGWDPTAFDGKQMLVR